VLRDESVLSTESHESTEDYSAWLLPAVGRVLKAVGLEMESVEAYVVASGPGSFTGLRVGLTTVKAWSEVYRRPIAAVSRLEALAVQAGGDFPHVAAFADAQRGQVFGAIYRRNGAGLARIGDEMVIAPGKFVESVAEVAHGERISWVSPDAAHVLFEAAWKEREWRGEKIESVSNVFAPVIGRIGLRQLREGRHTDALSLEANYVRRSDAEILWKGGSAHGR
jgi:tRNA threonylcarbamoyladenosine biosynthesis protein TsaB